jgi:two-component system, NarL family, response regulator DesR
VSVRILVGNDRPLLLDALAGTLRTIADFDVVGVARERDAVLPVLLRTNPRIAVLGAAGSGGTGLDLAREVLDSRPACGIVMVAPSPTRALLDRALRCGVLGVVPMDAGLGQLVTTIRGAAVGCIPVQAAVGRPARGDGGPPACLLTDRERDVLRLTWAGASVREVARELCLAPGTVRNVTSTALRKLEGRNRFDAARIAQERGWL